MPEQLVKLRPDRDLQCYFERPSAIAALSESGPDRFTLSGTWRQQNDWAVIEWNRDNVFEHPAFRSLPDGDLSGLTLVYDEERTDCIPLTSKLYPLVDWPYLRIWTDASGVEQFHRVKIKDYAVPFTGSYVNATADFDLSGTITAGEYVGIAWGEEHHTYQVYATDTVALIVQNIVASINAFSPVMKAEQFGNIVRLYYVGQGQTLANSTEGENGNRIGAYSYVSAGSTLAWSHSARYLELGASPTKWRVTIPFGSLVDDLGQTVNTASVRKMRWTYAADFQRGEFNRSEFAVHVTNWAVTGTGRAYSVAGPGSRRIEDDDALFAYQGSWTESKPGNFSGGGIHFTTAPGASVTCSYLSPQQHSLYIGTRATFNSGSFRVFIDNQPPVVVSNYLPDEDVLRRVRLGVLEPGTHVIRIEHAGTAGQYLYFDFFETAIPASTLPELPVDHTTTLATDWDTDHSLAISAERTAWMIKSLGFFGRANHYVGALWFYELTRVGHRYATGTITFSGTAAPNGIASVTIGRVGQPASSSTVLQHLVHAGDTPETIAKAFELRLNSGYTSVRAEATGGVLTIYSRSMGADGNQVTVDASAGTSGMTMVASSPTLTDGMDGDWYTDLQASPRLNRAVRDWSRSFYQALYSYGIDVVAAFSTELQHGDPRLATGIAQRYPSGNPVLLNTPALQTNFSPTSLAYWREVYKEMAALTAAAGGVPYLQFGEVQWWYFPYDGSGLPFYDAYTTSRFELEYGRPMATITSGSVDPALYPQEAQFVANLIGEFTASIMAHVRQSHPTCRFEVLYPTDVNDTAFNAVANYPANQWTPALLDNLKTESFTYTYSRDLNRCLYSVRYAETKGFPSYKRSHLVGISDPIAPWVKEVDLSRAENNESIVLFALDQFCLIGYPAPVQRLTRRSGAFET